MDDDCLKVDLEKYLELYELCQAVLLFATYLLIKDYL